MPSAVVNPYDSSCLKQLECGSKSIPYYDLSSLPNYGTLPYSIRVLLESCVRHCDQFHVTQKDVENICNWNDTQNADCEIPYKPARVLLQDFTGVPAVVDFAAMRESVQRLGGDVSRINPVCPADLVIDHSVQVDAYGNPDALNKNQEREFERNKERFLFLKWGAKAFKNLQIVPPGSGIVHQVNLEYLARVVFGANNDSGVLYPDSLVGTDSHTTMICGLGVLGWGVGGIEAEAVMLGQPISMVLPQVIGYRLIGSITDTITATDLVLTVTKNLRDLGVVGKFVEFFGPGVANLSIADRATISNMCPEYGATVGYFPVDNRTLDYLRQTSRSEEQVQVIEKYLKAANMFRDYDDHTQDPKFTKIIELDLSTIVPCLSGPKRPHDRVELDALRQEFMQGVTAKVSFKGYGISGDKKDIRVPVSIDGRQVELRHGSVCIAAITSCTNTSNPSVMLAAGLVAKNAIEKGLTVPPFVKTSLSPGSGVVTKYLQTSGLMPYLEKLGFYLAGYGCMTCIGNSGPLIDTVANAIEENDLVVAGVLSGNRNFEGRIHPHVRANYLASPPLVVAYAIAGRVDIDFEKEPIGVDQSGNDVFFKDIWPSREHINNLQEKYILPSFFKEVYEKVQVGSPQWQQLDAPDTKLYPWDDASTYIREPPFFTNMTMEPTKPSSLVDAYVLLNLGDSVTTDHISPAGSIARTSPAARYLIERGISAKEFNSYGARRGNDEVMARGTFANIRLVNKFLNRAGPRTKHLPSGEEMDIFDCAMRYKKDGQNVIILAGKEYGSGSSRDWAAKGPYLQGVKLVIAESYERIHRSNLVGMGIIPCQYLAGQNAESLGLKGTERFTVPIEADKLKPGMNFTVKTDDGRSFEVKCRFDTEVELEYYRNGGILQYMIRKLSK